MVVTQLKAHELAVPIILDSHPQFVVRMIQWFERGIRTALTKRLTKANGITELEVDIIERKVGLNGRGLQQWKAYRIGAYSYKKNSNKINWGDLTRKAESFSLALNLSSKTGKLKFKIPLIQIRFSIQSEQFTSLIRTHPQDRCALFKKK